MIIIGKFYFGFSYKTLIRLSTNEDQFIYSFIVIILYDSM
jgi:hypothetical protein